MVVDIEEEENNLSKLLNKFLYNTPYFIIYIDYVEYILYIDCIPNGTNTLSACLKSTYIPFQIKEYKIKLLN